MNSPQPIRPASSKPTNPSREDTITSASFSPNGKYQPYPHIPLENRQWPSRTITKAPQWCSVDLRDGNQAIVNPMNIAQKTELYTKLVQIGFKEIEIGFPSASETEFAFTRKLILEQRIPSDVTPQVLVPAIADRIEQTFLALQGAPRAIVHLYNSTSEQQRRLVFRKSQEEILEIALEGTRHIKRLAELAERNGTSITFQYSPESFTGTELSYAHRVTEAVISAWNPSPERKMILNLPATVELSTPNIYADQIEWFHKNITRRDSVVLSLHPHNDRGTAVAAAELGLTAGADRVEGTLFGNGERTGNVCLVTLAMNMYTQGIDPALNFRNIPEITELTHRVTGIPVHVRHPYAGALVFTAFSGTHQDAINKGLQKMGTAVGKPWDVPYLPINPHEIGRVYEPVRINGQSGKGGVAYIMRESYGCVLPPDMHTDFARVIKLYSDKLGGEITPPQIWKAFETQYLSVAGDLSSANFQAGVVATESNGGSIIYEYTLAGHCGMSKVHSRGKGISPLEACHKALNSESNIDFNIRQNTMQTRGSGSEVTTIAYVSIANPRGDIFWGAGIRSSPQEAPVMALINAFNRMQSGVSTWQNSTPVPLPRLPKIMMADAHSGL